MYFLLVNVQVKILNMSRSNKLFYNNYGWSHCFVPHYAYSATFKLCSVGVLILYKDALSSAFCYFFIVQHTKFWINFTKPSSYFRTCQKAGGNYEYRFRTHPKVEKHCNIVFVPIRKRREL